MTGEADNNIPLACPAGCDFCTAGHKDRKISAAGGGTLRGWRLALAACVAFIFPVALAIGTAVAAGFMPSIKHNETARMALGLAGVVAGIVIAALVARCIRPSARNADEFERS